MKRITSLIFFILGVVITTAAQENADTTKPWKFKGESSLHITQVSLTNWAAGGESSFSGSAGLKLAAVYKRDKTIWATDGEFGFGLLKQGNQEVKKTNDKLFLSTSYNYQASEHWYYHAGLSFKTQFAKGYNYPNDTVVISRFLAPAYILLSLGMDFIPGENFSLSISPVSGRAIIVQDDSLSAQGAFGVEPGKKSKFEFGGALTLKLNQNLMKNVDIATTLDLFTNYLKNPQNIDVNWELSLNMKINQYLAASITTTLIYDHDIMIEDKDGKTGPRTQFQEVLGIGFSYSF